MNVKIVRIAWKHRWTRGVNSTNVFEVAFLQENQTSSISVIKLDFIYSEIGAKAAHKMLVKLTIVRLFEKNRKNYWMSIIDFIFQWKYSQPQLWGTQKNILFGHLKKLFDLLIKFFGPSIRVWNWINTDLQKCFCLYLNNFKPYF